MPIARPDRSQVLAFADASALRAWLEAHHATESEAWFGYYRKDTGKTSVTYAEAVDQALCFGWIDGITSRVDDEVTTHRFTPRRRGSDWSTVRSDPAARAYWEAQAPAYRRAAAFWVTSAKREATRERRLDTLIADSAAGRPIKLLSHGRSKPDAGAPR